MHLESRAMSSPEQEKFPVRQIVALDFDRTLIDTEAVMKRFYFVANKIGVNKKRIKQIKKEQKRIEKKGDSFEPISHLRELLSADKIERFKEMFINENNAIDLPPILYDDVPEFLQMLDDEKMPYSVITYAKIGNGKN